MIKTLCKSPLLFLIVHLLASHSALGQTRTPHQTFFQTMSEMKILGVEKIGGQPLDDLIQKSQTIKVEVVPETRFQSLNNEVEGVYRGSGFWNKNTNTIYLSERHADLLTPKHNRWVVVHEFAEILGADDKNFHKSALMDSIDTMKRIEARRPGMIKSEDTLKTFINRLNQSQGGVSGVGGGGDGRIHGYMKLIYLELFFRVDRGLMSAEQFNKIYQLMSELDVEFSREIPQGTFNFDSNQRKLRFPNDPTVGGHFDLNSDAITTLVDLWLNLTNIR